MDVKKKKKHKEDTLASLRKKIRGMDIVVKDRQQKVLDIRNENSEYRQTIANINTKREAAENLADERLAKINRVHRVIDDYMAIHFPKFMSRPTTEQGILDEDPPLEVRLLRKIKWESEPTDSYSGTYPADKFYDPSRRGL